MPKNHKSRNSFNVYYLIYDRFMRMFCFFMPEELIRCLKERSAGGSLLDVGGGTGYITAQISAGFDRVVVLDESKNMLKIAKLRNLETCEASALAIPFNNNEFNVVICTDALHHIKEIEHAISEMSRVLKPKGLIVIQDIYIKGLYGLLFYLFERLFVDNSKFISPAELLTILEKYGIAGEIRMISRLGYIFQGEKL